MKTIFKQLSVWAVVSVGIIVLSFIQGRTADELGQLKNDVQRLRELTQASTDERIIYLKILYKKRDIDRELAKDIAGAIHRHAVRTGRDPDLILALALKESDLKPEAVSPVGAEGLIQVMPQWVKVFGDDCNLKDLDCNLRQGLRLLGVYEDLYGSLELALVAYNRGPNPVDWALKKNQNPDNGYALGVLEIYKELKEL